MQQGADTADVSLRQSFGSLDNLLHLVGLARRRRRLIACTVAVAIAFALVFLLQQTPVYRATAELLIDPQALQVVGRDIVRSDTSASLDFANIDSQAFVIESSGVLRPVVDELHLDQDPAFATHPGRLAGLFGSGPAIGPEQRLAQALDALKQSIVVHRVDNSLIFQIIVTHPDARQAAQVANHVAASYLRQGIQGRSEAVQRANASLIGQVSGLRAQLDQAEAAVEQFRSANNLIRTGDTASGGAGLIVTQQLKDLYTQIDAANAEVARLAARKNLLAKIGPDALLSDTIPEALNSSTIASLRSQYAQSAREAASLAQTLLPQHPRFVQVRAELAETRNLLGAELARIRTSIGQSYAQAAANLVNLQSRAKDLTQSQNSSSEAEIKLRQLQSEAEAVRAVFNNSLSRAKELEQQQGIETSNSRLLSDATPPLKSSKPPTPIVLAAAGLFGACLGLGLAYLLDLFPTRRAPRQLGLSARAAAELLGVNTAVTLPFGSPLWRKRPGSGSAPRPEALLAVHPVALALQDAQRQNRPTVVMTAGLPDADQAGEVTNILAQALADMGEDVMLWDPRHTADPEQGRRVPPSSASAEAAEFIKAALKNRPVRGRAAAVSPRSGFGKAEFIIARADGNNGGAAPSRIADAIVLVIDGEQTTSAQLRAAALELDPSGRTIVAIIACDSTAKPSRASVWFGGARQAAA